MRREQSGWSLRLSNLCFCAGLALALQTVPPAKAEGAGEHLALATSSRPVHRSQRHTRQPPPSAISHGHIVKLPDIGYQDIPEMPWPLVAPPADHAAGCGGDCGEGKTSPGMALGHRGIECVAGCYSQSKLATALGGGR